MSTYIYVIDYAWVHELDDINDLVEREDFPSLTSADQIISVSWDGIQKAYLVTWRVRKWMNGGPET